MNVVNDILEQLDSGDTENDLESIATSTRTSGRKWTGGHLQGHLHAKTTTMKKNTHQTTATTRATTRTTATTRPPPKKWVEYSKVLKKNNQNWIYRLWDEKSCLNLLVNNYPWFLDTYNNYKYQLQKVDSMRPFLLYHFGGIYFDMDFKCKKYHKFLQKKRCISCRKVPVIQVVGIS